MTGDPPREPALALRSTRRAIAAEDADLTGSTFRRCNLAGAAFSDANLAGATMDDVSLAGLRIGNADLSGLQVDNADLTGARLTDCKTGGMTIDGVALDDLLAAYRRLGRAGP